MDEERKPCGEYHPLPCGLDKACPVPTDNDPQLVRDDNTGNFGIYKPDQHVIETYIGDDRHEVHGHLVGENWHPVEQDELTESIEADIAEVREDMIEFNERDLGDEQARELERLESRLESYERILELVRELQEQVDA